MARTNTYPSMTTRFFAMACGLLAVALASLPAHAQVVPIPPDLNPGDEYRLFFVTSSDHIGDLPHFLYNLMVESDAYSVSELNALGTTWTAVVSTYDIDARENTATNVGSSGELGVPIYLVNGTRLADNYNQLWIEDGYSSLLTQPNIDESGSERSTPVWTGTQVGGTPVYPLGGPFATFGNSIYVDSRYLDEATLPSNISELALYGISSTLTVPPGMVANVTQSTSYHTLQEALDNAMSGDAIEIAEGTLSEDGIVFPSGLNVTITGAGKDLTFIDGGTDGTDGEAILKLNDGQTAATVISHLTLLNGADDTVPSQGSLLISNTSPTIIDVAFRDATGLGGAVAGIRVLGSFSTFERCEFSGLS